MRRTRALAVAVCLVAGSGCAAAHSTPAPSVEACFRDRIAMERASRNRPALERDERVEAVARRHSDEMSRRETIYHNRDLEADYRREGLPPSEYYGENVGMGPDCDTLHAAFMSSPAHREGILDSDFRFLGVGVTERDGTIYVSENFSTPARPAPEPKPQPEPTCK